MDGAGNMRILIIGGTKFIGPVVVKLLTSMGHHVTVFHRGETNSELPSAANRILGNKNNLKAFRDVFKSFAPDVVLDMIPSSEMDAQAVVDVFQGIARRIVSITSQDVYRAYGFVRGIETGPLEPTPITEDSLLRTKLYPYREEARDENDSRYHYDKILVERVVMNSYELAGTVLRLPAVYGPRDSQYRMYEYLKRMDDKRPFILLDESFAAWHWTHSYVENVAHAIALAVSDERSAGRIYNVSSPQTCSMSELVAAIGDISVGKGKS
ncbi:NAD-dependent epimerase/dehydratase family protein [Paenibacillus sp.]|uniref:NAD-dependent epimerase/dehydratase family protein n=1 Tax=Paenibacillus sp. TaxID=58172 RepID=UPI002D566ED8|nr:NAD-dependent epimerase/dehydratase family protein [Paenibacillus sp.]HZG57253.1 NAD-dependent epimerase/dehydratase family protein [Paenibacillus sp.]